MNNPLTVTAATASEKLRDLENELALTAIVAAHLALGLQLRLERDEEAPSLWAVWSEPEGDIIGSGDSPEEAIEEARHTVEGWARSESAFDASVAKLNSSL